MKKIYASFIVLFFGLSTLSVAFADQKQDAKIQSIVEQYLLIQNQLASDSIEGVSDAAQKIVTLTDSKNAVKAEWRTEVHRVAQELQKAKNLNEVRERFKKLSAPLVQWNKQNQLPGIQSAYCSMANAHWLQKTGDIRNPYYGKKMLECGELQ